MIRKPIYLPLQAQMAGLYRFSVAKYHKLIEIGILTEDDNLELLDGYLVHKMSRNPPHDAAIQKIQKRLFRVLQPGWDLRIQSAVTLSHSEPEPDLAVVRGDETRYLTNHPVPSDIGLVIEVADSTLDSDRIDKGSIYAESGIAYYWIVNLVDRQIEVYTLPSGPTAAPAFAHRQDYPMGTDVTLLLDGTAVTSIPVRELLP
ncbi:MAG TPA: Uma2 family endonuclease [Gemmataceae bacterium]|nr:Uma2 family endonuclease [Gemmataceae bacterium]